jgi:uncharacterized protein
MLTLILLSSCSKKPGRDGGITIGEKLTLHSTMLNEDRSIVVYLPPMYPQPLIEYPVVYMLDGDSHFHHASGAIQFLASSGVTPPLILVGIGNTDRDRDMTPTPSADTLHRLPTSGGAGKFLKFLTEELSGYMKSHYQVGPYRILVGHSLGGLFAIHTLTSRPESFNAYVAISPSLWWNKNAEIDSVAVFFQSHPIIRKTLYLTVGDEGENMIASAQKVDSIMRKAKLRDMRWKLALMPGEDHGSIVHRALYDGLEYIFSPLTHPPEDALADTAKLESHFAALSTELGYTVTPSEQLVSKLGFQLLHKKRTTQAITMFQYNVRRFPELADAYEHLSLAYEQNNQLELAIKSCELALEKARKHSDPFVPYFQRNLEELKRKVRER